MPAIFYRINELRCTFSHQRTTDVVAFPHDVAAGAAPHTASAA